MLARKETALVDVVGHVGDVWSADIFSSEDVVAGPFHTRIDYDAFERCYHAVNDVFARKNGLVLTVIFGSFTVAMVVWLVGGGSWEWADFLVIIGLAMGLAALVHPNIQLVGREKMASKFYRVHGANSSNIERAAVVVHVRVVREGAEEIGAGGGLTRMPFRDMCSWPRVYGGMVVLAPYDRSRDSLWYNVVHGNQYYTARTNWDCTGIVVPWSSLERPWRFMLDMHKHAVASRGVIVENGVRRSLLPVDEWMREAVQFNNAGLTGNANIDSSHVRRDRA